MKLPSLIENGRLFDDASEVQDGLFAIAGAKHLIEMTRYADFKEIDAEEIYQIDVYNVKEEDTDLLMNPSYVSTKCLLDEFNLSYREQYTDAAEAHTRFGELLIELNHF